MYSLLPHLSSEKKNRCFAVMIIASTCIVLFFAFLRFSDEEGESLLRDQRKRVRALIAATKGLTLQEKNFDESKNMEALSMVSGSSQPESPTLSEWPSVSNCGLRQSGDSWSENDSSSGSPVAWGSQPNPPQATEAQKRASLPLLKSLLTGPNYEKQTVNELESLECGSDSGILEPVEVSNQDSGTSRSSVEENWTSNLENVSEEDTGSLPAVNVIDIDLQERLYTDLPSSGVITSPSTSGANNSAVNKKYFMTQISNFFPSVSSGGVLSDAPKQSDNAVTQHNNAKHPIVSVCSDIRSSLKVNDRRSLINTIKDTLNALTPKSNESSRVLSSEGMNFKPEKCSRSGV